MRKPRSKKPIEHSGMPCPECGAASGVTRTHRGPRLRNVPPADFVMRERRCTGRNQHRFKTAERYEPTVPAPKKVVKWS